MENKVLVAEKRISHSIHLCFPSNISEPESSISDEQPLPKVFSHSITSIFPAPISESDSSSISDERLPQYCPSIDSIFPANTTQTNSPANDDEIIPYHTIDSFFPPRCDSDSDSFVSSGIIHNYLRCVSIQAYFPSFRSISVTSVYDHQSPSIRHDLDSLVGYEIIHKNVEPLSIHSNSISISTRSMDDSYYPNGRIFEKPDLKVFTFTHLKTATKNFNSDTLLGEGGFGRVFKGCMDKKTLSPSKVGTRKSTMFVAIKRLNLESMQGFQEWQSEVNFLGRLSHPNLVKLLGYCREDKELLLVYEFMQKGSLDVHLFRRNNYEPLSWDIRLKIAIGAARGLAFLHTLEEQVIHRNFHASNILLDGNFNAKISDFGFATLGPPGGVSHVLTRVMGTYGYAAPEYVVTGHLYVKSDVYGFGAMLLEMLTGLRALDAKRPSGQQNLAYWLKPCLSKKRKLKTIMDLRMKGQYSPKAVVQAAQLTLKCLESNPGDRPSMKNVVEVLEHIEQIKEKPKETKINYTHPKAHEHPDKE